MISNDNGESDVTPTESEAIRTVGNIPHGSWEIPETSLSLEMDRSAKARCHNADVHVSGKSDSLVVPEKRANKAGQPTAAESVEERGLTKENANQSLLVRTQRRVARSRGLFGVREAARQDKKMRFNNLLNHVTPELLRASFFDLKKQAVPGIDGVTWAEYAENFEAHPGAPGFTRESIGERTEHNRPKGLGFPSPTASFDPWGSQHWRTRSSNGPYGRFSNASTKRTFRDSVTAIVQDEAVTEPWTLSASALRRRK